MTWKGHGPPYLRSILNSQILFCEEMLITIETGLLALALLICPCQSIASGNLSNTAQVQTFLDLSTIYPSSATLN